MLTTLVVHEITVTVDNICDHPSHCRALGAIKIGGSETKIRETLKQNCTHGVNDFLLHPETISSTFINLYLVTHYGGVIIIIVASYHLASHFLRLIKTFKLSCSMERFSLGSGFFDMSLSLILQEALTWREWSLH
jgi:hypothetical protein